MLTVLFYSLIDQMYFISKLKYCLNIYFKGAKRRAQEEPKHERDSLCIRYPLTKESHSLYQNKAAETAAAFHQELPDSWLSTQTPTVCHFITHTHKFPPFNPLVSISGGIGLNSDMKGRVLYGGLGG